MILVTDGKTYSAAEGLQGIQYYDIDRIPDLWDEIIVKLKAGESLFYLGCKNIDYLKELWIHTSQGSEAENVVMNGFGPCGNKYLPEPCSCEFLHIAPPKTQAMHGIDDEPRMSVEPLITASGRYGNLRGYPGLFLKHYDKSLTGGSYKGTCLFVAAIREPLKTLKGPDWKEIIGQAAVYSSSQIYLSYIRTEFPLYYENERVRLEYKVENRSDSLEVFSVLSELYDERDRKILDLRIKDGAVSAHDSCNEVIYWHTAGIKPGVYTVRLTLRRHDRMLCGVRREEEWEKADVSETAFLYETELPEGPAVSVEGERILLDGEAGFFIGTHLYPSAQFFELSYRPVKVRELVKGILSMKQTGVKICRIWCDPILDEVSLRGMETVIRILSKNGIAADFMFFSSWVHYMEIHTQEYDMKFEVAHTTDERLVGLHMHNIKEQKTFVRILVERWNKMKSIIWDLSNEFSVVDPDNRHLSVDFINKRYRDMEKPYDNIDLFRQWASQIRMPVDECGNAQPLIYGVSCWDTGSDNYLCTKDADIIASHGYYPVGQFQRYVCLSNSDCIGKAHIIEEFGGVWPENDCKARQYDSWYHFLLGAGESAAMNYEWGVLWLNDSLSGVPSYLRIKADTEPEDLDDFVFEGRYLYGRSWPLGSTGICPWMASFEYGNIYCCVDQPSPAMAVMRHMAYLGEGLGYVDLPKKVYLVLPFETKPFAANQGYARYLDNIAETISLLHRNGVDFKVWQEDMLSSIPECAEIILYPNEKEIGTHPLQQLEKYRSKGVMVFTGSDRKWLDAPALEKLDFSAGEGLNIMFRDTLKGRLVIVNSFTNDLSRFTSCINSSEIAFEYVRNASFLWNDGVMQADFCGGLVINGRKYADYLCDRADGLARCLIRSNTEKAVNIAGDISLFASQGGKTTIDALFAKGEVIAPDGQILRAFIPDTKLGRTFISFTDDDAFCEIRLSGGTE